MPFLLETNTAFLNSEATPRICLFSGRMDGLQRKTIRLSHNVTVQVPLAAGEYRRWRVLGLAWLWPIGVGLLAGLAVKLCVNDKDLGFSTDLLAVALVALGALIGGVFAPSARRDCVRMYAVRPRPGDPPGSAAGRVNVVFPTSREHIFWEYLTAYKGYQATQGPASGVRGPVGIKRV